MKLKQLPLTEIQSNPNNPRSIKDGQLKKLMKSIEDFPQMLDLRPIVIDEANVVLGGNMRLMALRELGHTHATVVYAEDLTEAQKQEFVIKDNVGFGEWEWEALNEQFEAPLLEEWGMSLPEWMAAENQGTSFNLPDSQKSSLEQKTFTLSNEQARIINDCLKAAKQEEEYLSLGEENPNTNGNAIFLICLQWARLKK